MSRRASSNSCAAKTRRNAIFTALCTRIFCSSASISASFTSFPKTARLRPSFPPRTTVCCTKKPCFPPPTEPPRISASACRRVGFDSLAIFCACSSVTRPPCACSCALPIRGYSGFTGGISMCWCCSWGMRISCARAAPAAASMLAIIIVPNFPLTRMSFPLLLCELCVLRALCVKSCSATLRFMVVFFLHCRSSVLLAQQDGVIFLVRQNAHHRHHPHHSRAPIFWQAIGLGFFHHFIHSHFHESILREAGHAGGVFCNRRVMHVLEGHAFRERLHLAQSFCIRLVRG